MKIVTVRFVAHGQNTQVGLEIGVQMSLREGGDGVLHWYTTDRFLDLGVGRDMAQIVNPQGIILDGFLYFNEAWNCSYFIKEGRAPKKLKKDVYIFLQLRSEESEVEFKVTPVTNHFRHEEVFDGGDGGQTQVWRLRAGAYLAVKIDGCIWKVHNIGGSVQITKLDKGQDVLVLKEPEACNVSADSPKVTVAKLANGGTHTHGSNGTPTVLVPVPFEPTTIDDWLCERDWLLKRWEEVGARLKELGHGRSRYELRVSSGPDRNPESTDMP